MLVYVSGPYTANESGTIEEHVDRSENIAIELWRKGHAVIGLLVKNGKWGN